MNTLPIIANREAKMRNAKPNVAYIRIIYEMIDVLSQNLLITINSKVTDEMTESKKQVCDIKTGNKISVHLGHWAQTKRTKLKIRQCGAGNVEIF